MNRHTAISIGAAVIWLIVGIVAFVRSDTTMGVVSVLVGVLFAVNAFRSTKK